MISDLSMKDGADCETLEGDLACFYTNHECGMIKKVVWLSY